MKKPAASVFGSLQVECRFHRKTDATGCKKTLKCLGPDDHHKREVARIAMWWASQARDFDRQRRHIVLANTNVLVCPPATELARLRVDALPFARAPTDVELDGVAAAARETQEPKPRSRQQHFHPVTLAKPPSQGEAGAKGNTAHAVA